MTTTAEQDMEALLQSLNETKGEISEESAPLSPTLAALEPSRRPAQGVACATCPNSIWFASENEVRCYCRAMYLVTWSTREPTEISLCDGKTL
ncbi:Uncharacterised protein [Enterobacter hormaechei]|nr:Uncharacterised protein [Enterobacter hormaechei]SWX20770.1 Uncharacterised protein [Klebsiella pneumoniae]SAC70885.1 Uncharacterised protein [Enterobacter hormaechei]SAF56307.1 Uncharacterised protein [Enterobacter hormaechei]SAI10608.1 Uncharacterised protein [Enterobacter hormaechei]